jgi:xanthine dehydrogenase molybdenum-binding subunit
MAIKDYEPNMVLATEKFDVVGTRPVRHDGADKVTGRAQYGADFTAAGLIYGAILRSPHAHARIKSIDTSKAKSAAGILAVVTAKDFPKITASRDEYVQLGELNTRLGYLRDNILADDKVLYKGQPVAAVAAANAHVAHEALALIKVEYEVLPAVLTAPQGMQEESAILHDHLKTEELGEQTDKVSNVAEHFQHVLGDLKKGLADAEVVIEREFNTATVHQGYIEPHNATAFWNKDGKVTIWCSTQGPFEVRDASAASLGLDIANIKLVPMEIGGGFGGKFEPFGAPVAAMLSKITGKPVKIVMTRAEDLQGTGPTPGSNMKVKMGVTKDGKFTAAQAHLAFEAGAFPGSPVGAAAMTVFAVYDIPNVVVDGYDVVVNKPKSGAYRAPGATQAAFAVETVVDEIAEKLGIDPIELRLMNSAKEGTRRADGPVNPRIGCVEVLEAMRDHPHYSAPLEGKNKGRGVAAGFWINGAGESAVTLRVNSDGSLTLSEGSADIGGTRTSIAMQAAEVLGVQAESISPQVVDTDSVGYTSGTGGSSVTFKAGWAAYEAANDVKAQLIERASKIWEVDAGTLEYGKGEIKSKSDPELKMSFVELAGQLNGTGGPVVGSSNLMPPAIGGAYAGCIVDVEVDPDTGKTTVERFTIVQDAGKAIHPSYVEGQMQGGSVQGIGWALNEEYYMNDEGGMMNSSLLDYRIPVSLDLPMIDTVIVEVASPTHPFGVRGVGEVNLVPPPPAIANGIYRALGVRMEVLPMKPAAVMEAVWKK